MRTRPGSNDKSEETGGCKSKWEPRTEELTLTTQRPDSSVTGVTVRKQDGPGANLSSIPYLSDDNRQAT